jgi:hypothetical protein
MDLTSTTTAITGATGDVTTIGLAILAVIVAVASFRWIKSAMR